MIIVHLLASPFFGGPERQMLGLARSLPAHYRSVFLSFTEGGRAQPFLNEARKLGFEAIGLEANAPRYTAVIREVAERLSVLKADVLCCHGYKADILGWRAARRAGVPMVAVAHGWTAATLKVRLNETLDRLVLRRMDAVVCVSEGQAAKVRAAGTPPDRISVIHNAIDAGRFETIDPAYRKRLELMFPNPRRHFVAGAGRLSPEKGFDTFLEAVKLVVKSCPDTGFVLFGEGELRALLLRRAEELGIEHDLVFAGFRPDLDHFLPHVDLFVLPSYTEGLPNVVLEAFAAGIPVVATAVGGTPEVVDDGRNGFLVPPRDPTLLAERIIKLLGSAPLRQEMGARGRQRVRAEFTFAAQSHAYQRLFEKLHAAIR